MCMPGTQRCQQRCWIPGTGVTIGCKSPCGCCEMNPRSSGKVSTLNHSGLFRLKFNVSNAIHY
ncbi:hypothetical protein I79_001448 [Cricetulus griseus]|uniref:Uncharacterized protein n=1 Tax=Cricetulus griseus TaxID=10029 RepID=G3GUS5_CRIGR|nr:hypothetical protein I79_001448 [Cricetulus griseus]